MSKKFLSDMDTENVLFNIDIRFRGDNKYCRFISCNVKAGIFGVILHLTDFILTFCAVSFEQVQILK